MTDEFVVIKIYLEESTRSIDDQILWVEEGIANINDDWGDPLVHSTQVLWTSDDKDKLQIQPQEESSK